MSRSGRLPPKKRSYSSIPADIFDKLKRALFENGIFELYKHQAETISFVRTGRNTVIVTPTASGKTLCYNIPVMDKFIKDSSMRALHLFSDKSSFSGSAP